MSYFFKISLFSFTLIFLLNSGCQSSDSKQSKDSIGLITNEFADDFIAQIHTHKDIKDTKWLIKQLKSEDTKHLECLFNALASVKDSTSFYPIRDRISEENLDDKLFITGVNALGLLGPRDSTSLLIEMLYPDINTERSNSILVAIGNIGSIDGYKYLLNQKLSSGKMEGLYRSFLNGNSDIEVVEEAVTGIAHTDPDVRFWAAHLINRQRDHDVSPAFEDFKKAFISEKDQEIKIALAGCFKKVVGGDKSAFINQQCLSIQDPLILVNLIRSIDQSDFPSSYKNLISMVNHKNEQVAITAINQIGRFIDSTLVHEIASIEPMVKNPNVKAQILGLLIKHDSDNRAWSVGAKQEFEKQENPILKAGFIRALSSDSESINWINDKLHDKSSLVLQGVAHEVMLELSPRSEQKQIIDFGLNSDNVAMICQSAAAINSLDISNKQDEWISKIDEKIDEKIEKLQLPRDLEALVELKKAKAHITGEKYQSIVPKYNHPLNWMQIDRLPNRPIIELKTDKGIIKWELYLDKLPAAVSTIVNLVDSGYYDGKIFHRVVPNFVAQGGCPRGDGWGSLDFSLRSEYSHGINYKTGAIGLASAGENTESCQFFMCHSPTPHLDNRYSIIGYVVEGFDVLNNIELGDKIISMKRLN